MLPLQNFTRPFLFLVASLGFAGAAHGAEPLDAFLEQHCLHCHGPDIEEGGLRIDQLSRDFKSGVDARRWAEIIERINAGEMPPEGEPRPTQEEIAGRREGVLPPQDATAEVVAAHLQRFAERAWRRTVEPDELEGYLAAYSARREAGKSMADAYRASLLGVLTSRHFIYLVEGDLEPRDRLTDWELASRLSYFLWSSMPDDDLLAAARAAELSGVGLKEQVDRLLTDERIERFLEDFPRQWLQLYRLGVFSPNKGLYPRYDDWLEESLREEPIEFFREMFAKNLRSTIFWIPTGPSPTTGSAISTTFGSRRVRVSNAFR